MIKNFSDWISESHYSQYESFMERYDNVVTEIEENVLSNDQGIMDLINRGEYHSFMHFFDTLVDLGVENKFEDELEKIAIENFDKLYFKGYDTEYGEPLVNDEYLRIEKEVTNTIGKPGENTKVTKRPSYNQRSTLLNNALLRNVVMKHITEWKNVYKKWLNYAYDHRGELAGKRYGV